MDVVSQQYTNDKAVDFMAILTAIKNKKPDGIFFGGMDPQAGTHAAPNAAVGHDQGLHVWR